MTALAGEPLPVEFEHGGGWHPAVLLGWRHDAQGHCSLRVQFVVGGLRRSSWLPLTDVRLPAPVGPRRPGGPRTRPDLLLADRDRSLPAVPRPRSHDGDLSRV